MSYSMSNVHKTENVRKYRDNQYVKENNQEISSCFSHPYLYSHSVNWTKENTEYSLNDDSHQNDFQDLYCSWTASQECRQKAVSPNKGSLQEHEGYYSSPREYSSSRINTNHGKACHRSKVPARWCLHDPCHSRCNFTSLWQNHRPQFVATLHEERHHTQQEQEEIPAGWQNNYTISKQHGKTHCPRGLSDKMNKVTSTTDQYNNPHYNQTTRSPEEWYTYGERQLLQMQNSFYPSSFITYSAESLHSTQGRQPPEALEGIVRENHAQSCRTDSEHFSSGRTYMGDKNSYTLSTTKPFINHGFDSLCQSENKWKDFVKNQQLQDIESDFLSTDEDSRFSFMDSDLIVSQEKRKDEKNLNSLCQEISRTPETITRSNPSPDGKARDGVGPASSYNVKNPLHLDDLLVDYNLLPAVPSANDLIQFHYDDDFSFSEDDFSSCSNLEAEESSPPERCSVEQTIIENHKEERGLSSLPCHRDLPGDVTLQTSCHSPKTSGSTTDELKIQNRSISPKLYSQSELLSESTNEQLLPLTNLLQGGKRSEMSGNQHVENGDNNYCTGTQVRNEEVQKPHKKSAGFIRETNLYKDTSKIFKPKLHFMRKFEKSCRGISLHRTSEWVDCSADLQVKPEREWNSAEYGQDFTINRGSDNLSVCVDNMSHTQEKGLESEFILRKITEKSTYLNNSGCGTELQINGGLQESMAECRSKEGNKSDILIRMAMRSLMDHPDTTSAGLMEKNGHGVTPESLKSCTIYYWCHVCEISLKSEKLAIQHQRTHDNNCQTSVNLNSYLRQVYGCVTRHWKGRTSHREGILHICGLCDEVVTNTRSFRNHIQSHGERIKCKKCARTFFKVEELQKHSIQDHSKAFKKTALKPRKRMVASQRHKKARELFICEYCNKNFSTKGSLKIHTRLHTGILPFKCSLCSKGYPQNVQLKIHMKSCRQKKAELLNSQEI